MLKKILKLLFSNFRLFTASYSNNVFPEPLDKDEEEKCINEMLNGNLDGFIFAYLKENMKNN